jgi:DNA-binding transcriptional ArsR family regulator
LGELLAERKIEILERIVLRKRSGDFGLSDNGSVELEGTTFSVYLYVAKESKPVGPRDVMRGAHLSSPSVAYRHLQKLEDSGLLKKNEYGEYLLNKKMKVNGYHWFGRHLLPNAMFYFYFFLGLFIAEVVVLAIHYAVETYEFKIFFALGIAITAVAMVLFLKEGLSMTKKIKKTSMRSYDE